MAPINYYLPSYLYRSCYFRQCGIFYWRSYNTIPCGADFLCWCLTGKKSGRKKYCFNATKKLAVGEVPAAEMVKSVSLILAGILLLIPGFFTDFLGLLLLPPLQALLVTKLISRIQIYSAGHGQSGFSSNQNGTTFEGEFQRKEDSPSNQLNNKAEDQDNDHFLTKNN